MFIPISFVAAVSTAASTDSSIAREKARRRVVQKDSDAQNMSPGRTPGLFRDYTRNPGEFSCSGLSVIVSIFQRSSFIDARRGVNWQKVHAPAHGVQRACT
jgi:hypothetical protein